jgi:hypothetical protein
MILGILLKVPFYLYYNFGERESLFLRIFGYHRPLQTQNNVILFACNILWKKEAWSTWTSLRAKGGPRHIRPMAHPDTLPMPWRLVCPSKL